MSEQEDLKELQVRQKSNGDLIQRIDGKEIIVAHYDRTSGHLEFTTKENSVKLYNQVVAKLGAVNNGTQPSGNVIRTIGVLGETAAPKKKLPPRPKMGPHGDAAEEQVQYWLDNDMPQAIIRYGIYTDEQGRPIRKDVRRVTNELIDNRNEDSRHWLKVQESGGKGSESKGPVTRTQEVTDHKNAIIARRATPLTFTPNEVIGGYQPEEEFEQTPVSVGGDE